MMSRSALRSVVGFVGLSYAGVALAGGLADIKKKKTIVFAMRERDLVYSAKAPKQLHNLIAERFAEYLSQKTGVQLKSEIVVAKEMSQFWANDKGEVKQGEEYKPALFSKADVYTDVLTVNAWRQKLAEPVSFLPVRESFMCNFKVSKLDFEKVRADKIKLVTVKQSSFHTLMTSAGFKDEELEFAKDTGGLIPDIEKRSEKACALLDSDFALFKSKTAKATFAGTAGKTTQTLAWWTAKDNADLNKEVQAFWKEFQAGAEWKKLFLEAYGMEFTQYSNIMKAL
jgi:hypothetical protein